MNHLPEEVTKAWEARNPLAVLTTVSKSGTPNTVYVSCYGLGKGKQIMICDIKFGQTLNNLKHGKPEVSFLFQAPNFGAYQLKGIPHYATDGEQFEQGKAFAKPEATVRGVLAIEVTAIYKGSENIQC
ncbi:MULTISPECIES: pyridoxamine 5'-phosphate oxidase family protein [unclassified Lentimonas]|uniref:pyridoxamine 5'-phosphate oxidase family protein n=1 Tax=unclassified Lentimonas TaxID=2630993 RepID=UPI00132C2D9C|nr:MULTISPECIES: pyridoxamine 5'-phosphate oxidase family protein [unclassified Lentimonas]CAA6690390.1 Unannotated [Lentimonas sp. CC19]CAA6693917.1 Unannotated [Lentimonas sp. CC10]CAA7068594.1 Unannotated [Lentimonas sp. CC11]